MKNLKEYLFENSKDYSERVNQCNKISKWLSTENFPKSDERWKIKLNDNWYCVLDNVKFSNNDNSLISISIQKDNKEFNYYSGKYYGNNRSFEDTLEKYLYNIRKYNNWYEAYVYDTFQDMKEIIYNDKDFNKVKEINLKDIK